MEFKVLSPTFAKSKKAFTTAVKAGEHVLVENVSDIFEHKFYGYVSEIPTGKTHTVVGPCPHTKRSWYASISRTPKGIVIK
jgi:hypothetical protein